MTDAIEHGTVRVIVTFAAAAQPYTHDYVRATTAATVQTDAMRAFGITTDGTDRYYLRHDGAEVPPDDTVGQLAGEARALHLALRTETISG